MSANIRIEVAHAVQPKMSEQTLCKDGSAIVQNKTAWLAALVVTTFLLGSAAAGDAAYGLPDPPPNNLRPYSQRSFRNYYLHRMVERHRHPWVESYPVFEVDVAPSYSIKRFPCPYVYPSELVSTRETR